MALPANLYLGAAGWSRPEWADSVFARRSRPSHALARMAEYVNLAEIDQTFHQPLRPEIAALGVRMVEGRKDFQFTALLGRRFTYDRDLCPAAVAAWKQGFQPLLRARRLGAVVLQFPWSFRFNRENREFLITLRRTFHEFPLAAEFRHESWLADEAVTTLVNYRVSFVNVDQPQFFRAMPPAALLTSGVAVVRLHGRQCPEAFKEFHDMPRGEFVYDIDQLLEWKPRIERLARHASRTLVSWTNGENGASLVNALQMGEVLGSESLLAPPDLVEAYPSELAAFRSRRPVQPRLVAVRAA
jgi:uncharacterized protein YecE (DUF72 family)